MKYSKLTNIAIIGSGGHARSSINLLLSYFNVQNINIFDDSFEDGSKEVINSIPLVGLTNAIKPEQKIFLSVGDNYLRRQYFSKYRDQILKDNICHNNSFQEQNIKMGSSNQIYANSYINSEVTIGDNNIINTGSIIEHNSILGSHNHISVGVKICGRVSIGDECLIGAGAIILNNLSICNNVTIGAGSVVICNIHDEGTYVGNPAKRIK
jgi:UDP-N-acetylbacillosamine N-acetyltransferase